MKNLNTSAFLLIVLFLASCDSSEHKSDFDEIDFRSTLENSLAIADAQNPNKALYKMEQSYAAVEPSVVVKVSSTEINIESATHSVNDLSDLGTYSRSKFYPSHQSIAGEYNFTINGSSSAFMPLDIIVLDDFTSLQANDVLRWSLPNNHSSYEDVLIAFNTTTLNGQMNNPHREYLFTEDDGEFSVPSSILNSFAPNSDIVVSIVRGVYSNEMIDNTDFLVASVSINHSRIIPL